MRLVVANTSPIFYSLSIGHIDLLPRLFGRVFMPDAVHKELCHPSAPPMVRDWAAGLPAWADVTQVERSTTLCCNGWALESEPPSRLRCHYARISSSSMNVKEPLLRSAKGSTSPGRLASL